MPDLTVRQTDVLGACSSDGTFLSFGPDKNLPRLRRWQKVPG